MKKKVGMEESNAGDGSRAINRFHVSDAVMVIVISLLCLTCILPFVHVAAKSFSDNAFVSAQKVTVLPKGFTLGAYHSIIEDGSMMYSMGFSVIVTLAVSVLGLVVSVCGAYPLTKKDLPFRPLLTFLLVFPMYFGAGLIPTYLLFKKLHLLDTVWVLIVPVLFSPYNMLVMKAYFQSSIPDSLEESAFLDGASFFQILGKIILPLSKPIIATLGLFYAVGRWNSYGDNLYYIKMKPNLRMIQYKLYLMISTASESQTIALSEAAAVESSPEVLQAAAVMFATVPIICIYPFLQKYFVKGAMIGSVKG